MKLLLLDIETAPNKVYSWGLYDQDIHIDQIVEPGYTLCWAAKWLHSKTVAFDSVHHSSPKKMAKGIHKLVNEADAVVHYNGRKFDMPHLKREWLLYSMEPPDKYADIDLLSVVRKEFKFSSNKLDYVAQQLGLGEKVKHKGMALWKECMDGCPKAWATMKRYNIQDVRLLERVYDKLLPWISNHPNWGLYVDADRPTCRKCGSHKVAKVGVERTATQTYQRYRCLDCRAPLRGRARVRPAQSGVLV